MKSYLFKKEKAVLSFQTGGMPTFGVCSD